MLTTTIKVLKEHGYQAIPDLAKVELPAIFRGRVKLVSKGLDSSHFAETMALCPTGALTENSLDMGRCTFCGECAVRHPKNVVFTNDYLTATSVREELIVRMDAELQPMTIEKHSLFSNSLKLRQISAGGDASCEMELNACGNVNFDMARHGIDFLASPRHCDGVVITGPITKNMAREAQIVLDAVPEPRLIILVGTDSISGGLFEKSPAVDRSFLDRNRVHLYIPGNPPHPMTFIRGLRRMMGVE